jgi:hypothetical protein
MASIADDKHHEDPTKVVTKLGLGYSDDLTFSGSIGLDQSRMINARINTDASEWRLGGSWLFDMGIMNFNFSRSDYDGGSTKDSYSVGTFVPMSYFGFSPGGWQLFPMAGFNYSEGEIYSEATSEEDFDDLDGSNLILISSSSNSAYIGGFALKPLTEKFSFSVVVGGMKGSDDYSSYWAGTGVSYKISGNQSCNVFGFISDDDYGRREKVSFSYSYQFN